MQTRGGGGGQPEVGRGWPSSPTPQQFTAQAGTPRGRIMLLECVFASLVGITWGGQCRKHGGHLVPAENYEVTVSGQKLVLLKAREQSFLDADV